MLEYCAGCHAEFASDELCDRCNRCDECCWHDEEDEDV